MRHHAFAIESGAPWWAFGPRGGFRAMTRPHRGHGHGPPHRPGGGFGWGGPPFGGPGSGFGRRARMRRGDVRAALLVLLAEEPRNGYGLMQEIERRSGGAWKPSPGSVYPALQQLEDEGLVRSAEAEGRRRFELTDAGRAHVDEHREQLGEPWKQAAGGMDENLVELRDLAFGIGAAVMQVASAGDQAQIARAKDVLADTRRTLYRILAGDEPTGDGPH
jgi:DNA-binding PadR family transcriptional regulator